MKIAIIGHGNVGGTLARGWAEAGHQILIGARDPSDKSVKELESKSENITSMEIRSATEAADVILVAIPAPAVSDLAKSLRSVSEKVIIDATNSVFKEPDGYKTGAEAIKAITGCEDVAKGFNTTGYENMANPKYGDHSLDMFTAGDSKKAKETVANLAYDIGFENCYDFGGDDKFELIEQFAMAWINLAIMQGEGRNIGFKVLKR
ncbi:MAG: NAD(P)-binding domain-containing protein [Bacteroidetes bacterium]|jgi:predicted dinucleotide-binding enzyme|nr:NAD(P)-binding domain-containing protein [Bacteroidota bacterium]